jgi:hypothetical protein
MKIYLFVLSVITKINFNTLAGLNAYFAMRFSSAAIHKSLIAAYFTGSLLSVTLFQSLKEQFSIFVVLRYSMFLNWVFLMLLFVQTEFVDNLSAKYWLSMVVVFALATSNSVINCAYAALSSQMRKKNALTYMMGGGAAALVGDFILCAAILIFGESNVGYSISMYLIAVTFCYLYLFQKFREFETAIKLRYSIRSFINSDQSFELQKSLVSIVEEEQQKTDKELLADTSNIMFGLFFVLFVFVGCFPGLILEYNIGLSEVTNSIILTAFVTSMVALPRAFLQFITFSSEFDKYVQIITLLRFAFFKIFKWIVANQTADFSGRAFYMLVLAIFGLTTGFNLTYFATRASMHFNSQQNMARSGMLGYYASILGMFCGSIAACLV